MRALQQSDRFLSQCFVYSQTDVGFMVLLRHFLPLPTLPEFRLNALQQLLKPLLLQLAPVTTAHLQLHLLLQVVVLVPQSLGRCVRTRRFASQRGEVAEKRRHFHFNC
jgi:hypothetical protein